MLGRYVCNGLDEALASTTGRPDARPFDMIVVGGGSFGAALAQHALDQDAFAISRILVLEAGPFVFPEHVQNLPLSGWSPHRRSRSTRASLAPRCGGCRGGPTSPAASQGLPTAPVGGRCFGAAGPRNSSTPRPPPTDGPRTSLADLRTGLPGGEQGGYFHQAARQIGITPTNDFIFGPMHEALRRQLRQGSMNSGVTNTVPLGCQMSLTSIRRPNPQRDLNQAGGAAGCAGRGPRAGFFPFNKFSSMPLLIKAARRPGPSPAATTSANA